MPNLGGFQIAKESIIASGPHHGVTAVGQDKVAVQRVVEVERPQFPSRRGLVEPTDFRVAGVVNEEALAVRRKQAHPTVYAIAFVAGLAVPNHDLRSPLLPSNVRGKQRAVAGNPDKAKAVG